MANKRANARAKASKMKANHSWPWVIVRIIQITFCVIALGLSIYLRFSYKTTSLRRRDDLDDLDDKDDKKDYSSTPPWLAPPKKPVKSGDDEFYYPHGMWGFSPSVSLGILMAVSLSSLLSSFASLILYCLGKLYLKFVMAWDFFLSVVWLIGVVFIGKLITDNEGWGLNDSIANLYKLDFALGGAAAILFIISGGLAVHLIMVAKTSGGNYAPMAMAPPYKESQSRGDTGTSTPAYSTYNTPSNDPEHDAVTVAKPVHATEHP